MQVRMPEESSRTMSRERASQQGACLRVRIGWVAAMLDKHERVWSTTRRIAWSVNAPTRGVDVLSSPSTHSTSGSASWPNDAALLFNHQDGWAVGYHLLSSTSSSSTTVLSPLCIDVVRVPRYIFRVHLALGIRLSSVPSRGRKIASDNLARETFNTDIAARFSAHHC
jgi:hypothetical protein